jgi:hypothetical protein
METNQLPKIDMDTAETGCCPKFNPEAWDGQEIVFDNKKFVKAKTLSIMYMPLNMGPVFAKTCKAIEDAKAFPEDTYLILTHDKSPWRAEHLFAVTKDVDGQEMVNLSGIYLTKVFEGDYKEIPKWIKEMDEYVAEKGREVKKIMYFYTTCPKCAKHYGRNYVVLFAKV